MYMYAALFVVRWIVFTMQIMNKRPDLRVIVSSATMDAEVSEHFCYC